MSPIIGSEKYSLHLPVELLVVLEPLDGVEVPAGAAGALPGVGAPQLRRRAEDEGVGHAHLLDVQLPRVLCKGRVTIGYSDIFWNAHYSRSLLQ